jgi:hypothetical protein
MFQKPLNPHGIIVSVSGFESKNQFTMMKIPNITPWENDNLNIKQINQVFTSPWHK